MQGIAIIEARAFRWPDLLKKCAFLNGEWTSEFQTLPVIAPETGEDVG